MDGMRNYHNQTGILTNQAKLYEETVRHNTLSPGSYTMSDHRLQVLEQKLLVMQKEVSEVIGELQQAMTALMRSQAIATAVTNSRLTELEKIVITANPVEEDAPAESEGKEKR